MSIEMDVKTAFERECGRGVRFEKMMVVNGKTMFRYRLTAKNTVHHIETVPTGGGRDALTQAATQAGKWARLKAGG